MVVVGASRVLLRAGSREFVLYAPPLLGVCTLSVIRNLVLAIFFMVSPCRSCPRSLSIRRNLLSVSSLIDLKHWVHSRVMQGVD
jgi:hypothetical protein